MSHAYRQFLHLLDNTTDLVVAYAIEEVNAKKRKRNRPWVRDWIARRSYTGGTMLLRELRDEDPDSYRNALRMTSDKFDELLLMIESTIQKEDTRFRAALPARLKLELTLRFLATGDSFKSLQYFFRVPTSTISTFLPEVLQAITSALSSYIKTPCSDAEWKKVALQFSRRWNFPRCIGAIDGKHINLKQPPCSGSDYFNYKKQYSVILMALVDGNYNFLYVNVGSNGRASDGAVFQNSQLFTGLEENTLNVPKDHVILGDSAFPLKTWLMKPYPRKQATTKETIFNYRLSRARRIVENAFGILCWRFRVFLRTLEVKVDTVDDVVLAACSLHNWLRETAVGYLPAQAVDWEDGNTGEIIPGLWRAEVEGMTSVRQVGSNNYSQLAEEKRDSYKEYFWNEGSIPFQWKAIGVNEEDLDDLRDE